MNKNLSKIRWQRGIRFPALAFLTSGIFIWDQVRRLKHKIDLSSSPKVWTRKTCDPEYIYINDIITDDPLQKFEIGNLPNELYKIIQLYHWLKAKFKGSQLYEDVFSFHQNLAWRLLNLTQDNNYFIRRRAVLTLSKMPSLSDATCMQLAQASDKTTAVGLARCEGANLRLLLDPPGFRRPLDLHDLRLRLHYFLLKLNSEFPHPCLQYVIAQAFAEQDHKGFDDDVGFNDSRHDAEIIPKCAEAIFHHSWLGSNSRSIVLNGGLPLLIDVYRSVQSDPDQLDTLIMVSRTLSNISMHPDFHQQLFSSGCIKVLGSLLQHPDMRVSVPAGRALLNCDTDAREPGMHEDKFMRNVYPLRPIHRSMSRSAAADVVFIHGLLGGIFVTWRERDKVVNSKVKGSEEQPSGISHDELAQDTVDLPIDSNVDPSKFLAGFRKLNRQEWENKRTQCWPRDWLARDIPQVRILGVNYDTNISMWAPMCPIAPKRLTLSDRSNHLTDALLQAGLGSRPIIWVAHSMGGLIVKDLLVKCSESKDDSRRAIFENTKGIIFFSTPHRGSRLATMNRTSQMIAWPTVEVQELRQNSPALLQLHDKFLKMTVSHPIRVLSFAERAPTLVKALKMELTFVEAESSRADVGELYGVPLDHLCVCKPAKRDSFLYKKVLHFIEKVVSEAKREETQKRI